MSEPSRRRFLGALAAGSGALAGCASILEDDDEPPPIDVTETELAAIRDIEVPVVWEKLPVGIADDHVASWRERVRALLEPIPAELADEIPNEAVREYIDGERERAHEWLDGVDAAAPDYAKLSPLRRARRSAAEAEGAYAAAVDGRRREDVYEAAEAVEERLAGIEDDLTRTGEDARHAVVVYGAVEGRLDRAASGLGRVDGQSPLTSEVEAVGDAAGRVEGARAHFETVSHILDRQAATVDDGRALDDEFARVASALLDDVDERIDPVPSDQSDAHELFDAPIADTPRERVARELVIWFLGANADRVREHLDDGRLATALLRCYRIDHELRTVDRLRARVAEGDLDRPADAAAVRESKEAAIAAIESVRDGADHPALARRQLGVATASVDRGDWYLEERRYSPERAAVEVVGLYELGRERARALPGATEWFVDALP